MRQAVFVAGDAVFRAIEKNDRLYVSYVHKLGVSLIRDDRLVLAFGDVAIVPLGNSVSVDFQAGEEDGERQTVRSVTADSETKEVLFGDVIKIGSYDVYEERSYCIAISTVAMPQLKVAVIRSAILSEYLGRSNVVNWDQ